MRASEIISAVHTHIDRVPFSGEVTARVEDVMESPSATVADEFLLRQIYSGQQALAAVCRAIYMPALDTEYQGTVGQFDESLMIRPIVGTVYRIDAGGTARPAVYRTVAEHHFAQRSGREATPMKPAYTWDDTRFQVFPEGGNVRFRYIREPNRLRVADLDAGNDTLDLSDVLREALTCYVTAKAERQLTNDNPQRAALAEAWEGFFQRLSFPFRRTVMIGSPQDYMQGRRVVEREGLSE